MGRARDRRGTDLRESPAEAPGPRDGVYFDQLVHAQGDFNPFAERGWETLAARFAAAVPAVLAGGELRLLDVGCGTGQSRRIYLDRSSSYVGLDLSLGSLRLAQARFAATGWAQADACRLPFSGDSFDVVAFSSVLHHLADRPSALAEALRVLRPGGWAFAFDPNLLHPAMLLFRHPRSPLYKPEGVSPDEQPLLPAELRRAFRQSGFAAIGQRCQSDIPYRAVAPQGLNALLGLYNRADRLWEKVGLGRWFGTFVVTWARKP